MITPDPRWIRVLAPLLALTVLVSACGGDEKVGDESLLEGTDEEGGGPRLGETTTTTAGAAAETTVATTAATAATAPPTTAQAAPSVEIAINSDTTQGGQFQPRVAQVPSGAIVRFVNKDTVARSVVADAGSFDSGPIAPGASWDWTAGGAGSYNYSDGTRPYAVGSIEVV